ncbi:MAG: hypothetical protein ABIP85_24465 [Chthoniobacteraceae bacterium]
MKAIFLKIFLICLAFLAAARAAPIEGGVIIANEGAPIDSLSAAALKDIYTGRMTYWSGGQPVVIAVMLNSTEAALKEVSGMDASQFKTFWQRMVFSGRGQQPKMVDDVATLVALVASTRGAIALVPAHTPMRGVKVVEIK